VHARTRLRSFDVDVTWQVTGQTLRNSRHARTRCAADR